MIAFILSSILFAKLDLVSAECTDIYGRSITPGIHFIPGPDICQLCVCDNTTPKWCKRVLCSPPQNCKSFVMGSSCCDYSCLDNTIQSGGDFRDEIDRRFLITIATAFLILTVLLFIIHKLRHRTIHVGRLQNRQLAEDRRSIGSIGFITGSIGYLNLSNGHHFDDHPLVHFPVYKPHANYFPRGEAPPPYDEAMADTALNISAATQLLTNDREILEFNEQRRRCNSAGIAMTASHPINTAERCNCEPQQPVKDNRNQADLTNVYGCAAQHRTIPLPICVTPESLNQHGPVQSNESLNRRSCPIHNKKNDATGRADSEQRSRANSTGYAQPTTSTGHGTCPPQFHLDPAHATGSTHRTLPLSASLSSPLPSTSDSCERQPQFTTFSSAINISSVNGKEPSPSKSGKLEPLTKQSSQSRKSLASVSVTNESQPKPKKSSKCSKERAAAAATSSTPNESKEPKPETDGSSQLVDDYHAECENCNLNVKGECDGPDEYFPEQETMTLQRKLHEASTAKTNDQKASLTLPTNSRTKRCSSKNRKCGRWNGKESPFKTMLELVSSEEEEKEADKSQPNKTTDSDDKV
ncbi:uncharacterized protein LOC135838797 [Planococcus citri]|uniref:uncharacterized protein LOC135838797 n=1 Tax=Planococcus citri TaxID=170843 RepID=UPI0031F99DF9